MARILNSYFQIFAERVKAEFANVPNVKVIVRDTGIYNVCFVFASDKP